MTGEWRLPALVWSGLVIVAVIASLIPAFRASRLQIVDALRYV
jgi:ABC-type lipoprotein release transport system permease subunit